MGGFSGANSTRAETTVVQCGALIHQRELRDLLRNLGSDFRGGSAWPFPSSPGRAAGGGWSWWTSRITTGAYRTSRSAWRRPRRRAVANRQGELAPILASKPGYRHALCERFNYE